MIPPRHALGADLVWWRAESGWRTRACLFWSRFQPFDDDVSLHACLIDSQGRERARWMVALQPDQAVFIDSGAAGPWCEAGAIDGLLALYACTAQAPSAEALEGFRRLYPFVEWQGPRGELAALHSDQVAVRARGERIQKFTEIVVLENEHEHNALVILNGEREQRAGGVALTFRNADGQSRTVSGGPRMAPFTAHRVEFAELVPDLRSFARGAALSVDGSLHCEGLFTRPYVVTEGAVAGAYHAGDVYRWPVLNRVAHDLTGGWINPMAVMHDAHTRTWVNVLHSHEGEGEGHGDDVPVTVSLYDLQGRCVAHRPAWTLARRHGVSRFEIAGLLPDPACDFRGHVALTYAPAPGRDVPGRLQALLEYRRAPGAARIMAWSDEWNSNVRRARRRIHTGASRSFCPVVQSDGIRTEVALTNAGPPDHNEPAAVELELRGPSGASLVTCRTIEPHATLWIHIDELFPGWRECLGPEGFGMLVSASASDLAMVFFTSGVEGRGIAAEHFLAIPTRDDAGRWLHIAGE